MDKIAKAYIIRFTGGKAAQWVFDYIEAMDKQTDALQKKERGEIEPDKFKIGE